MPWPFPRSTASRPRACLDRRCSPLPPMSACARPPPEPGAGPSGQGLGAGASLADNSGSPERRLCRAMRASIPRQRSSIPGREERVNPTVAAALLALPVAIGADAAPGQHSQRVAEAATIAGWAGFQVINHQIFPNPRALCGGLHAGLRAPGLDSPAIPAIAREARFTLHLCPLRSRPFRSYCIPSSLQSPEPPGADSITPRATAIKVPADPVS